MNRILLLAVLVSTLSFAQQPSHYRIGEEQFSGVDIYDLHQDKHGYIWICSNDGLYRYDGYEFKRLQNSKMKNRSLFNLCENKEGEIHCNNLYGQIFKVSGDSLRLIFTIPDSLKYENIYYNIDDQNNIVFSSTDIYRVEGKYPVKLKDNGISPSLLPKNEQHEIALYANPEQKIYYLKKGKLCEKPQSIIPSQEFLSYSFLFHHIEYGHEYINQHRSHNLFKFDKGQWRLIIDEGKETNYSVLKWIFLKDCIFRSEFNGGCKAFDLKGNPLFNGSLILNNYQLSSGCVDAEGNIWLGTLGKGLIVIPNLNIIDFDNHPILRDDDLKKITSDNKGNVYVGGFSGNVYKFSESEIEIVSKYNSNMDFFQYIPASNELLFNQTFYDINRDKYISSGVSSIKNMDQISPGEYLLATNQNLKYVIRNKKPAEKENILGFRDIEQDHTGIYEFKLGRCTAVAYDDENEEIWVGTNAGLKLIKRDTIAPINHNNEPIASIKIIQVNREFWVATSNSGILIFKDGEVIKAYNENNGLPSSELIAMKRQGEIMLISTKMGTVILNLNDHSMTYLTTTNGLASNRILDFELVGKKLWLISGEKLQIVDLAQLKKNKSVPNIEIRSILVNNETIDQSKVSFDYYEDQFEFNFVSVAFRHRGTMTYEYRLEGVDEGWQTTNYLNNTVKYTSIPSGDYKFKVRCVNEDGVYSNYATYQFSIAQPFWRTWWFYLICALFIALVVASYFLIRISLVKRRLQLEKQLKASEVTAIKAQMNPHFVFNALNSVQDLVMQNDIRESSIYLGKFADLMRKTLDYSGKEKISLQEEISLLKLYLDLEKLRFGEEFEVSFKKNLGSRNVDEIYIPTMILQPYVENAVKHGLLHKNGTKKLSISFSVVNKTLICEIVDNGIGRKKSVEIQNRQSDYHHSFASEAIQKRLDLVNAIEENKITLNIHDLVPEGSGTKVVIQFPI